MKNQSDFALVELATQGNQKAFNALCTRHHSMLVGYLTRRFGPGDYGQDIEDIVQETLFKAWKYIAYFRGDSKFSTWLCTIGRNAFLNHVAHERRHSVVASKRLELNADGDISSADTVKLSETTTPEQYLDGKQQSLILDGKRSAMPPELQEAFYLRDYEQLSYEAIARKLGIPIGTVRSRIHRARKQLGRL